MIALKLSLANMFARTTLRRRLLRSIRTTRTRVSGVCGMAREARFRQAFGNLKPVNPAALQRTSSSKTNPPEGRSRAGDNDWGEGTREVKLRPDQAS